MHVRQVDTVHRLRGTEPDEQTRWVVSVPFILMHLMPLGIFYFGFTWREAVLCFFLYYVRMFFITGAYHRYFSHRSYKTSRWFQFVLAVGGSMAAQKGVLWWASHHRHHHKHSDQPDDVHSPKHGVFWSHVAWIVCRKWEDTDYERIKDFAKYPELVWLNKLNMIPPALLGISVYLLTDWRGLFGGFFLSTMLLYHGTFTINSFTHLWGSRRYVTTDTSRNSLIFALITLGEGWHNNHHYYQSAANNGFFWWEIDITFYVLKVLSWLGIVWDLRLPSEKALRSNLVKDAIAAGKPDIGMLPTVFGVPAAPSFEEAPAE